MEMEAPIPTPGAPVSSPGLREPASVAEAPAETPRRRQQMNLLIESLARYLGPRPDVYVGGNMGFYFSSRQLKQNEQWPLDVFVALDVIPDRVRKAWVVWEEDGRRPDVIIDLGADAAESRDRDREARTYASVGVGHYYRFNPHVLQLEGFELRDRTYQPMTPAADGSLPCPPLRLRLAVRPGTFQRETGNWLRWLDEAGAELPSGEELADETTLRAERLAARLRAAGLDPDA